MKLQFRSQRSRNARFGRKKEALRAAAYSFVAGAHYLAEEAERCHALSKRGEAGQETDLRRAFFEADYAAATGSSRAIELFADILDEEELHPFGSEWPREELWALVQHIRPPELSWKTTESERQFRFKKGFKNLLLEMAEALTGESRRLDGNPDHWMSLLLNVSFHASMMAVIQVSGNSRLYQKAVVEIETEPEPWNRYPQLMNLLDRQLRRETRRRTGLVTELDY